ncbi:MAG: CocE/NonD family hydrolase [Rhodospirillales bacterium]|nr:CocE/NonD family hydrolase [Rhodospirillales bacterium]
MTSRDDGTVAFCEVEHLWIPMPDGTRLAARLWLPEGAERAPVPAVLEYIPYRKRDLTRLRDERNHRVFAAAGYASMRVDMRGSGDSEGLMVDMYGADELDDAIAVITWLSEQPWCDGNVGMFGQSWGGTASLQAAQRRHPALKAVLACCGTNNRFDDDIHHMGGCLLTDTVEWGAQLPAIIASPPDPQSVGDGWRAQWMTRLEAQTFPLENWIRHEWRDDYWRHGAVNEDPDAIACPVLAVGGWADRYSNTVMTLLEQLGDRAWGIVGPWGHHYAFSGNPGPIIGFQQEALRWWDRWLKGIDTGIDREPHLRVWRMEYQQPADWVAERTGCWIAEIFWPSPRVTPQTFHLADGRLNGSGEPPTGTAAVPVSGVVGLKAGDTGYFGRVGGLPLAQQDDDVGALVFESAPLEAPFDVLGQPVLELKVLSDQPVATLHVRLNDVPPEGDVGRVSYVIRNLALDDGGSPDDTLAESGRRRCRIVFPNTAYRFEAGHRIRLVLADSCWPQIWPAPDLAHLSIEQASARLHLPRRNGDDAADRHVTFARPLPAHDAQNEVLRNAIVDRTVQHDSETGRITAAWHNTPSLVRFGATGLEFGSETRCEHTVLPGSPQSATCRVEHSLSYRRDDWFVEVRCVAELSSTPTTFQPRGRLTVRENGETLFERDWSPNIPRTCS